MMFDQISELDGLTITEMLIEICNYLKEQDERMHEIQYDLKDIRDRLEDTSFQKALKDAEKASVDCKDNALRLNQMMLELKGVVAMTRGRIVTNG